MADKFITRGAVALRKKLQLRGAQADLARGVKCTGGLVNHWTSGHRIPSAPRAAYIEKHYGIPVAWWGEPASASRSKSAA